MTHIPEIGAKNWYWFPDLSDMQFGTEFFWCWFLVTNRTIFVLVYGTSRRQFSVLISGMCVIGIRLLLHVIGDVRTGSWWIFQPSAQHYSNKIQASLFYDITMQKLSVYQHHLHSPSGHASESDDSSQTVTVTVLLAAGSGRLNSVICPSNKHQSVHTANALTHV